MVRVKKGGVSIDPGPVDAEGVVLPIVWKAEWLGVVAWDGFSLRNGRR